MVEDSVMTALTVLWVLLLGALTAWLVTLAVTVRARLRPPRLTALKALFLLGRAGPRDMGFEAEAIEFESSVYARPVKLAAWYVAHPEARGRLVIVLHGYADSSAGACAWLPILHRLGVNTLLVDLPGHGESGDAPCTAGWMERRCVWEVIDQFRKRRPDDAREIVLYGLSMGASVALAAAALRPGITAVIADSPYADFREASVLHGRLFGMPGTLIQRPASWIIGRLYGIDFGQLAPKELLASVPCPVLLIQAGDDRLVSDVDRSEMEERIRGRRDSHALTIGNAPHLLGLSMAPGEYAHCVSNFIFGGCDL